MLAKYVWIRVLALICDLTQANAMLFSTMQIHEWSNGDNNYSDDTQDFQKLLSILNG